MKVWKWRGALGWAALAAAILAQEGTPAEVQPAAPQSVSTGTAAALPKPEVIEPLFVRPLTRIESGRNDSNPTWAPSGALIAFERSTGDKKEIVIAKPDGTVIQTIYYQLSEDRGEMKFFFPGVYEEISYNAGITWSSAGDRFIFMSNGGEGNYDLYLRELGTKTTVRLTDHKEKDGQAHWSPKGDSVIFVSGRTGKGDIYQMGVKTVLDSIQKPPEKPGKGDARKPDVKTPAPARLTQGGTEYLYPQWSPDGRKIAMILGTNENHDIAVITDPSRPMQTLKTLTSWTYDDLRPAWSPDGRKIAFYSNYNPAGDPKVWSLLVIAADGSDPMEGDGLAARVAATDVIPDVERGPAWMPDSVRILYVKNDRHEYNPIYVADTKQKTTALLKTDTKMNHDVSCAADGTVAFRAQVNQWDQIFVMKLKE